MLSTKLRNKLYHQADEKLEEELKKAMLAEYSDLTLKYLEGRPKEERSPIGQFITPRSLRQELVQTLDLKPGMRVLDPGVGTGEFLATCLEVEADLYVEGWDIDEKAAAVAEQLVPRARIKVLSALQQEPTESFDIVVGNPPYFEIRNLDPYLRRKFCHVIGGRPNIFSLFFAVGLGALKPGGKLGFVVPPSMNNGAFFAKLRSFLLANSSIEFLKVFDDSKMFTDAQTAVQLIVLQKDSRSQDFTVDLGELARSHLHRTIFVENRERFVQEFKGKTTLWNLGYEAITGTLVWNQHKEKLRKFEGVDSVPLLWAHNITEAREIVLDENHPKRPQYVLTSESMRGPAIIVNRITGSVRHGSLRCAIVPENFQFLGENHVNIIRRRSGAQPLVDWDELLDLLRAPNINERIQALTGNTQISCVELTHYLPLDKETELLDPITLF